MKKLQKGRFFRFILNNLYFIYVPITSEAEISPIYEIGRQIQGFDLNFEIAKKNRIKNICRSHLNGFDFLA